MATGKNAHKASGSAAGAICDQVRFKAAGLGDIPVIIGGIIPPEDADRLRAAGVVRIYSPKDYQLNDFMADIVKVVDDEFERAA